VLLKIDPKSLNLHKPNLKKNGDGTRYPQMACVQQNILQAVEKKNKPAVDMHINCYIGCMIGSFA